MTSRCAPQPLPSTAHSGCAPPTHAAAHSMLHARSGAGGASIVLTKGSAAAKASSRAADEPIAVANVYPLGYQKMNSSCDNGGGNPTPSGRGWFG